ncbi:Hypothetical protein NTJ_03680 [Nesidiocoris tenuis]|uniref:Reverse transcriptase/retrotransposon-derived protein RNase H-like domain-containing protein n=1 Tax=Nesidiocoris tenuis TaxID=355587 RepID=A0ABN7AJ21_9HEMI|nr:Hypothetical protein NTJ_03680 [Nesidiocoris tenuis]
MRTKSKILAFHDERWSEIVKRIIDGLKTIAAIKIESGLTTILAADRKSVILGLCFRRLEFQAYYQPGKKTYCCHVDTSDSLRFGYQFANLQTSFS